ncbi:hypothetical protein SD427_03405 [Chryseobacterium sp. JJR-5R]|uniref:hypothetical protein n=1 Tax=Chryseobacterium sp. JJR-5R TaxID=3093923 RepID=UPI002A75D39E|nr:hypothetical protein [Chryseobacterium sp. JJR-5R]WPO83401.1 hypothetical protein SD427_03405 [Chryseobacterium sp. JJR-5R]
MKIKLSVTAILSCSVLAYSQVGINTQTPRATLDVIAKNTNGTTPEGFIPPRLTGNQVQAADAQYGVNQRGAIIYITAPVTSSSTKTANITSEGYYYFNGSLWQNMGISSAPSLILPNYANSGEGITLNSSNWSGWNYTGTSITLPPNSRYVVRVIQNFDGTTTNQSPPSNTSIRILSSFADVATASSLTASPDIVGTYFISGIWGPSTIHGHLVGDILINNTSSIPKTYYYYAGLATTVNGFNMTIRRFGGINELDTIYAFRVN